MNLDPQIFGAGWDKARTSRTCSIPGCDREHNGKGLCATHRQRRQRDVPLERAVRVWRKAGQFRGLCSVRNCGREVKTSELCANHYRRKLRGHEGWDRPLKVYRKHGATKDFAIRVKREVHARLKQEAEALGRDLSEHVRIMLEEHVARRARGDE